MQYCWGGKKSNHFSPGSDFTDQTFTGELSGVDSAEVLRQVVSAKRITAQILVISKLNGRKDFILRVFVCDIIRPSKE